MDKIHIFFEVTITIEVTIATENGIYQINSFSSLEKLDALKIQIVMLVFFATQQKVQRSR